MSELDNPKPRTHIAAQMRPAHFTSDDVLAEDERVASDGFRIGRRWPLSAAESKHNAFYGESE